MNGSKNKPHMQNQMRSCVLYVKWSQGEDGKSSKKISPASKIKTMHVKTWLIAKEIVVIYFPPFPEAS